jgi:signal transduction histidine kinase/CheY-like chemotaxis protein
MDVDLEQPFTEARRLILRDRAAGLEALEAARKACIEEHESFPPVARCAYAVAKIDADLYDEGLEEATRAADEAKVVGDGLLAAWALQTSAISLWRMRRLDEALVLLGEARELAPAEALTERAGIEELDGLIQLGLGDVPGGIEKLLVGRDLLEEADHPERLARNGVNLLSAYRRLNDMKRALEVGLETRRAFQGSTNLRSQYVLAFNLASVYVGLEDWEGATGEIERARGFVEESGARLDVSGLDSLAAQVAIKLGDSGTAAHYARKVVALPDEEFFPLVRTSHLSACAEVLAQLELFEEADVGYARSLELHGLPENETEVRQARLGQLELWLELGRIEEVRAVLDELGEEPERRLDIQVIELDVRARAAAVSGDFESAYELARERASALEKLGLERADRELKNLQVAHQLEEGRAVRSALERSNEELAARVREKTQALERALRLEALGRLAGGVAHDFNNLLTVLGGSAQLLEAKLGSDPEAATLVTEMLLASERGARLTERLLAFGRRIDLSISTQPIDSLLLNTRFLLERLVGEDVDLVFCSKLTPEEATRCVKVDEAQLDSVLMNLALNARDAMPGGGCLSFVTRVVEEDLLIDVVDSGSGISERVASSLFEPFVTTKAAGTGTGLGLASSLGLVEEMGGSLHLAETSATGSTFRVRLPLVSAEVPDKALENPLGGPELEGLHALVVEDDAAVRGLLAAFLRHLGMTVSEAFDGQDACERLAEAHAPDLVVCDVSMPRCTGPELFDRTRALGSALPFLFVSGWHGRYLDELPRGDPTVDFLEKPIEIAELAARLRALMAVAAHA